MVPQLADCLQEYISHSDHITSEPLVNALKVEIEMSNTAETITARYQQFFGNDLLFLTIGCVVANKLPTAVRQHLMKSGKQALISAGFKDAAEAADASEQGRAQQGRALKSPRDLHVSDSFLTIKKSTSS